MKKNLSLILSLLLVMFAGCSNIFTENKKMIYDYNRIPRLSEIEHLNFRINNILHEDTTHYFLISIARFSSLPLRSSRLNEFTTQYLFVYVEEPNINSKGEHQYDFYWKVYKFTNYSNNKYLGKVVGGFYHLIMKKLYDILNDRQEANIRDKIGYGLEFTTWINFNGKKITNDIFNGGEMDNTFINLFTLVKSAVYELELENYYQELDK